VRPAILLSVIPGLLSALAILWALRPIPRPTQRARVPLRIHVRPLLHGQLGQVLVGAGLFEVGHVAATLLILRATQLLTPSLGLTAATQVALALYTAYNVAATLASVPAGRLSDRRGAGNVLAAGVMLFLLAYLGFALTGPSLVLLGLSFVLAGLAIGCVETSQHTAVASLAPPALRGSAFGLLATVQSVGNIMASALAGLLWSAIAPRAAFLYLVIWMVAALALLSRVQRRQPAG